jgi:hypothetical protein
MTDDNDAHRRPTLEALAEAPIPTRFGPFSVRVYRFDDPSRTLRSAKSTARS